MITRLRVFASFCLLQVFGLSACNESPSDQRILGRVASPDKKRELVYAEDTSGGATVASSSNVFIAAPGAAPRMQNRISSLEGVCRLGAR